jgi:hypothetical protein
VFYAFKTYKKLFGITNNSIRNVGTLISYGNLFHWKCRYLHFLWNVIKPEERKEKYNMLTSRRQTLKGLTQYVHIYFSYVMRAFNSLINRVYTCYMFSLSRILDLRSLYFLYTHYITFDNFIYIYMCDTTHLLYTIIEKYIKVYILLFTDIYNLNNKYIK